jgi:nucleoside phosphorylase
MSINLVVALMPEAKPLISHFDLAAVNTRSPLPVFQRDGIRLIVSGIGAAAAAAATGYLFAQQQQRDLAWLNVGVAGHGCLAIGEGRLIHKISEHNSGRNWFPPQTLKLGVASDALNSVSRIERRYAQPQFYDMEAAAYYATACRFSSGELVQCFKIVSDNPSHPVDAVNADTARTLIGAQMKSLDRVVTALSALSDTAIKAVAEPAALDACLSRWSFTVTQQNQLYRLLQRLEILEPAPANKAPDLGHCQSATAVLAALNRQVNQLFVQP